MRRRLAFIVIVSLFAMSLCSPIVPATASEPSDVSVLMLIASGFGWNYFDVRDRFESWGVNVTTVAYHTGYEVPSCLNRNPRPVTADLLLSEIDNETLLQFDSLFISSGGHWQGLVQSQTVLDTIAIVYDLGLSVAVICTGTRVLVHANNIVNGSSVVGHFLSYSLMIQEGARVRAGQDVVVDNRLITGGAGSGTGEDGWLDAPTSEVCAEVVKEALGLSYVTDVVVSPLQSTPGTSFAVIVEVSDLETELGAYCSSNISSVAASIYWKSNGTLLQEVQLSVDEGTGRYVGNFVLNEVDNFVVDIEVEDSNSTLEIVGDVVEVAISVSSPYVLYIAAGGVGLAVAAVAVVYFRKRS